MKQYVHVGAVERLVQIISQQSAEHILLFTGGDSYASSGAAATIDPMVASTAHTRITNVEANPTIEAVTAACDTYREVEPDLVIAVGGGSVIDLAKSVRVLAPQTKQPRDIVVSKGAGIEHRGAPLVAIPTTSGTGSEVTHFAVVYVDGTKHSLTHEWIRPDRPIVDPALTYTLPAPITAATGLDALAQAIESFWSIHSTDESTAFAEAAMHLAHANLSDAVHQPDPESRRAMSEASHLAGRAIDITTTTAPHALSYTLTSEFGVPHGNAVAITLGAVLEYNAEVTDADCMDPRGVEHVQTRLRAIIDMFGASSPRDARLAIESLVASLDLPVSLTDIGASSPDDRARIASSVNPERLSGNPRSFTDTQLTTLVASLD